MASILKICSVVFVPAACLAIVAVAFKEVQH